MRARGGDDAVFQCLQRAREIYRSKLHEHADVDQLASLFAECVIAEAQPVKLEPSSNYTVDASVQHGDCGNSTFIVDGQGSSILAETGRTQIVLDAFADGSSFVCLKCGGLVSTHRKEEHFAFWCQI